MAQQDEALRSVEQGWNAAARDWTPAALAALYTDDAVFYGGRVGHSVGRAQIQAYFESYVGMFTTVQLALVDQELRMLADGVVLAQGTAAFTFGLSSGATSQAALRSTLVLVRRAEGWRILQHHFSPTPAVPPVPQE